MLLIRFIDLFTFSHDSNKGGMSLDVACGPFKWPCGAWMWPCMQYFEGILLNLNKIKKS